MSCGSGSHNNQEADSTIVSRDTIEALFADVQLAEVYIFNQHRVGEDDPAFTRDVYRLLLEKYKLNFTNLSKSIRFYAMQPKELQKIYSNVVNRLTRVEAEMMMK